MGQVEKARIALAFACLRDTEWADRLQFLVESTATRLYLFFTDFLQSEADPDLLARIVASYDLVAATTPRLDLIPCLTFAGWSKESLRRLDGPITVYGADDSETGSSFKSLVGVSKGWTFKDWPIDWQALPGQSQSPDSASASASVTSSNEKFSFAKAAVGGTFDRLHAGHRILLAVSALVTTTSLYIGVTGDRLLLSKKHKELLESYEARAAVAAEFTESVRPGLQVSSGPLLDPKARTQAASDQSVEALIVSQETVSGGEAINEDRRHQGFQPLALVVVKLVGVGKAESASQKLSSTALREQEAAELHAHSKQGSQ